METNVTQQTIKIRNPLYGVRDRYFCYIPEFLEYTGTIVANPSWLDKDYITMTSGNQISPLRLIRKEHLVGYDAPKKPNKIETRTYEIKSSSRKGGSYVVTQTGSTWMCNCVGFGFRRQCRHVMEAKSIPQQTA
jgi:hypothetical protein